MTEKSSTALIPIEEQKVDFYGDELVTALVEVNDHIKMYVPLRPICDYLGVSWSGQRERIMRDPVLSEEMRFLSLKRSKKGGNPQHLCLPVHYLHGWLFGIKASRVKPDIALKLRSYQRECFQVLWDAFQEDCSLKIQNEEGPILSPLQITERVRDQCRRAQQAGLPATLTITQWLHALEHFHRYCAYCQNRPAVVLDHFIPLSLGGGTVAENCVPSCFACNSKKGNTSPSLVTSISKEVMDRVRIYLISLSTASALETRSNLPIWT